MLKKLIRYPKKTQWKEYAAIIEAMEVRLDMEEYKTVLEAQKYKILIDYMKEAVLNIYGNKWENHKTDKYKEDNNNKAYRM